MRWAWAVAWAVSAGLAAGSAGAQEPAAGAVVRSDTQVQTAREALAQDALQYGQAFDLPLDVAEQQLAAQEASAPFTDALQTSYADRLAGIAVGHSPDFHIDVLLTGDDPVPETTIDAAGLIVPVRFHTGARATRQQLLAAVRAHGAAIAATLARSPSIGIDQRTGELVAVVDDRDVDREGAPALAGRLQAIAGVPLRIRAVNRTALDMAAEGGARLVGYEPADGHRYACTAGFVVTDGARTGIATAAHCPDALDYVGPDGQRTPLAFVGQWGWGFQDVQINASETPLPPRFLADTAKTLERPVTGVRPLGSMRAGDFVCHRGEKTGYSCASVELVDFAPGGALCGGQCSPTWVTVGGPNCHGGDSGAPVFAGERAFGIVKGGAYRADGSCAFYFYMATDFLPAGWRLLLAPPEPATAPDAIPPEAAR